MKLALGTVQFGLDYGISNKDGKVAVDEVAKILASAKTHHISTLDTGSAYGNSEQVLGDALHAGGLHFDIIDKIPDLETSKLSIQQTLEQALKKLRLPHLEGLLFHNCADLNDDSYAQLSALKAQGLVKKIGVSVYYPKQASTLSQRYDLDLIQCPLNLFDQSFIHSGCIDQLKSKGIEVHARSLFLQGLLLMDPLVLGEYFAPYQPLFERLSTFCREMNITRQVAALKMAHVHQGVDKIVVGVCSQQQLEEVVQAYQLAKQIDFDVAPLRCHEEALTSPFLWPQQ
ncbi:MAG: aryl-alcohol dehydrogenase-like predicted oxidoreductase [Phenylobacterium sp.]|jgi:aryl-alcohol dehydrogenase-like predicted oxidoreductase